MLEVIKTLLLAFTTWRTQVIALAKNVMSKTTHDTALGWVWLYARPAMYVFSFWFALGLGLKGARVSGLSDVNYIFWLSSGIIPWFFISPSLSEGANLFRKYNYLVNRLKFQVPLIPVFHSLGKMFIHLLLLIPLAILYFVCGGPLDIYVLQLPISIVLMYLFALGWGLFASSLSAFARDVCNLIKAFITPIFWLSGILFDVSSIGGQFAETLRTVLYFNPVTFLISGYRGVFVNDASFKGWMWDNPLSFWIGIAIILVTFVLGVFTYSRLQKDIPDVI